MTQVPAAYRAIGILVAALIGWSSSETLASAQTTTPPPPPKKKTPTPPAPAKQNASPPVAALRYNGVISIPAASNLAGIPYASGAMPVLPPNSMYSGLNSYYPGLNTGVYSPYPAVPNYYSPYLTAAYPYQTNLPGFPQYPQSPYAGLYNNPLNFNPYNYGLYAQNPLLQAYPSLLTLGQPNPFGVQMGLYSGMNFPGAGLPQFTGLASWNNPFGIGMGLGGLGN